MREVQFQVLPRMKPLEVIVGIPEMLHPRNNKKKEIDHVSQKTEIQFFNSSVHTKIKVIHSRLTARNKCKSEKRRCHVTSKKLM